MQTLTYLISFIALAVLARAFFSGNNANEQIVRADNESVMLSETKDLNNYLDSSVVTLPQNDVILYPGQATLEPIDSGSNTATPEGQGTQQAVARSQQPTANTTHGSFIINNGPLPSSINHEVIFFPQAPDGNRNLPRQEACEEASIALANYFIKNKPLTRDQFRSDLLALVDRQMELFNDYIHTSVEQTKQLYLDFYGGDAYILDNPTIRDIKSILAQGHIIVAPFAGRKLGNPYYSGQGPWYHMMVIKGYDDTHVYTNDVGTRRGENFKYTHAVIMEALHDLDYDDINAGAKRILVITE